MKLINPKRLTDASERHVIKSISYADQLDFEKKTSLTLCKTKPDAWY
jgi:hypothetical protein